jgi:cellulose synthase/poly-beta-1,6-N-acetylglucosamine synthase-like glycosyltransferase
LQRTGLLLTIEPSARGYGLLSRVLFLTLSFTVTFLFFLYGFNCYYLLAARRRYRSPAAAAANGSRPAVSVHLPVYNEKYVIGRLLDAVACMATAYGKDKVRIVVLDDSDDDTRGEVDHHVARLASLGMRAEVLRRQERTGYKAGALQAGLENTEDDFIAVFDADFVPPRDFLLSTVPHFVNNPRLGVVQARWDHLDGDYNALTRAFSIGIDVHFLIEQPARYAAGCFLNFNGSCGVIRRRALEDAGGWQADTLAEDLDASYRMQLGGYRVMYLKELACHGEVPPSMPSYARQQARWACGSLRTARKLLPRLLKTPGLGFRTRLQGFLHLTYYMVHPLMFTSFLLACIGTIRGVRIFDLRHLAAPAQESTLPNLASLAIRLTESLPVILLLLSITACTVAPWLYPFVSVKARGLKAWRKLPSILLLGLIGFGISLSNTVEAGKALLSRRRWEFVRTPKYALRGASDSWKQKKYQAAFRFTGLFEAASAILGLASIVVALRGSNYGVVPMLGVFVAGFSFVAILGFLQSGKAGRLRR